MKKNKLFNSRFLALFLGLSFLGLTPIFALDDDDYGQSGSAGGSDLTSQVMALNAEIKAVVMQEKEFYLNGPVDDSCLDNFTTLHNQFMDVLVHYKPFEVKWANYNPIKNFKVTPGNADELSGLLQAMEDTNNQLDTIFAQMQNLTDCSVPVVYDSATYVYPSYPVYTYVYPDYSTFYYPLLFGIGAWGLWNSWGWWDGHHWRDRNHGNRGRHNRRDGHHRNANRTHRNTNRNVNRNTHRTNTNRNVNRNVNRNANRTNMNRNVNRNVNRGSSMNRGSRGMGSGGHSSGRMGGGGRSGGGGHSGGGHGHR